MKLIKSTVKIKKFPSFIDFKPVTDLPEFSKYNLIYGWNGSGKTTFSRILRLFELQTNQYDDPVNPAEFEFKLSDNSSISNRELSTFKEIRVFNKDFIEDSVFCDGGPKPIFFLGKENKEDKEKITKTESELASLAKDLESKRGLSAKTKDHRDKSLSNTAKEIKNALTTARIDKYRNYEKDSLEKVIKDNTEKLKNPSTFILNDERLISLKKSILQASGKTLSPINVPNLDLSELEKEVKDILAKSITSEVIESLKSDTEVSKWVEHGLGIHKNKKLETCAFCNQKIPPERIKELESHFNEEYQKTIEAIRLLKQKNVSRELNVTFPDSSSFYDDLVADYLSEKTKAENTVKEFNSRLKDINTTLEQKEKNLFTQPTLIEKLPASTSSFAKINEIIAKHNEKTTNFEQQITTNKETLEFHYIAEFIPTHNFTETEYANLEGQCKTCDEGVKAKEAEIKKLKESLINHHVPAKEINEGLEKFLGRADIQLKATDVKDGYQITRNGVVAKNLSEGEKTALGIVYFITKIKEDGFNLSESVIVIDDPVSSLDSSAIFQAFSFLKESIKDAGQIFVLTHHFDFFRQVKNWFSHCKKDDREFFMVVCREDSGARKSQIIQIDKLLIDYESEYHFLFSVLHNFSDKKQTDLEKLYPLPNVARKFLESFLAFRVPILKKSEPNIYNRLKEIKFDETKKTRINRFVETHSHPRYESGVQDFDMTILAETPAIISDILEMVKVEDEKHYNFLVQSLTT